MSDILCMKSRPLIATEYTVNLSEISQIRRKKKWNGFRNFGNVNICCLVNYCLAGGMKLGKKNRFDHERFRYNLFEYMYTRVHPYAYTHAHVYRHTSLRTHTYLLHITFVTNGFLIIKYY